MALELGLEVDAPQVGMAGEPDPEHVEDLALRPVGGFVDGDDGIHLPAFGDIDDEPEAEMSRIFIQLIEDGEPRPPLGRGPGVVEPDHVAQSVETLFGLEERHDRENAFRLDADGQLFLDERAFENRAPETRCQGVVDRAQGREFIQSVGHWA
jgi:hypothetical protein